MTDKPYLKPCPFCGGEAICGYAGPRDNTWWEVACQKCGSEVSQYRTKTKSIAAWNARSHQLKHSDMKALTEIIYAELVKVNCGLEAYYQDMADAVVATLLFYIKHDQSEQIAELEDKIDGLKADLDNALVTCIYHGATDYVRLNYPKKYPAKKYTKWLNIYKDCDGNIIQYSNLHNTLDGANQYASDNRIACIKVEFEEGEGL